jgi:hypothetical protein
MDERLDDLFAWSLSTVALAHILNDVVLNRRTQIIDDANHPGELTIIGKWSEPFGLRFDCSQRTFAFTRVGSAQHCEPLIRA